MLDAPELWGPTFLRGVSRDELANELMYDDHGNRTSRDGHPPAHAAVIFHEADVLRVANLIDTPGIQHRETDDRAAEGAVAEADVLIFLSQIVGFLSAPQMLVLVEWLDALSVLPAEGTMPPLRNLFILASHAHSGLSQKDIDGALGLGATRLDRELGEFTLKKRADAAGRGPVKAEDLRARMFPFWVETPEHQERLGRTTQFLEDLRQLLDEELPELVLTRADREIQTIRMQALGDLDRELATCRASKGQMDRARKQFVRLMEQEPQRRLKTRTSRDGVMMQIERYKRETLGQFEREYNELMTHEKLVEIMGKKYSKDNSTYVKDHIPGYLLELLKGKASKMCERRAAELKGDVEGFTRSYDSAARGPILGIKFDALQVLTEALMENLPMAGALAVSAVEWAKAAGLIAAGLGGAAIGAYALGYTTTATVLGSGALAAIGLAGALTGGLAIAGALVIGGLVAWASGALNWRNKLATKLIELFRERRILPAFLANIEAYWDQTSKSFDQASKTLEREYAAHLKELGALVSDDEQGADALAARIGHIEAAQKFFTELPWQSVTPIEPPPQDLSHHPERKGGQKSTRRPTKKSPLPKKKPRGA